VPAETTNIRARSSGLIEPQAVQPEIAPGRRNRRTCTRLLLAAILATSKRAIFASRILDHLKFATYFDGIYGSVPGGELDHKPELLSHILAKHSLSLSRSVMVGDRRYDISGAHAVGMRGLGVLWGYGTRDELETAGADRLVDSPADLARAVRALVG
jgi:phosphoglycolate phosphatase